MDKEKLQYVLSERQQKRNYSVQDISAMKATAKDAPRKAFHVPPETQVPVSTRGADEMIMMHSEEQYNLSFDNLEPADESRPGAFREGGMDGSDHSDHALYGDIEQGVVTAPNPHDAFTLEATIVDEAAERARYEQDLDEIRKELEAKVNSTQPDIVPAEPLGKTCKERFISLVWSPKFWAQSLFLVAAVVALAVMISINVKNIATPPLALPSLLPYLKSVSPDDGTALEDWQTPQFLAATWLAGNANLTNMSNRTKIQRYVLATLYYSTGGKNWHNQDKWMTDAHECEWYNTKWEAGWKTNQSLIHEFCENPNLDLERIFLENNNLQGQLPLELSLLSESLVEVDFREADLRGLFPEALLRLSNLPSVDG
jgi:hypothetical protein